MAAFVSLSKRDINVLGKIRDPESDPTGAVRLDPTLPKDPHITNADQYGRLVQREKALVFEMQQADMWHAGPNAESPAGLIETYRKCVAGLGDLVQDHPDYASARNNRAQAMRRLYGDDMLLRASPSDADAARGAAPLLMPGQAHSEDEDEDERAQAALQVLTDLDEAVALLLPASNPVGAVMSPTAARTLSLAFTQRAAIYYATSKRIGPARELLPQLAAKRCCRRPEAGWTKLDFEEAASRDFAMGGRFGNEIARGLAVGTNPTAKLCGQMVQQMMKNEYGSQA